MSLTLDIIRRAPSMEVQPFFRSVRFFDRKEIADFGTLGFAYTCFFPGGNSLNVMCPPFFGNRAGCRRSLASGFWAGSTNRLACRHVFRDGEANHELPLV